MDMCVSVSVLGCGGEGKACIGALVGNQDAPSISMHVSADILLEGFPVGESMNFTWSYYAQFWRNTGPNSLPPCQPSSQIGELQFPEAALNWNIEFGNFRKMSHQASLVIPEDRKLGVSITIDYPLPVPTTQKLWFHMHSISLIFDGAPSTVSSSPPAQGSTPGGATPTAASVPQGRTYKSSEMAALGVILTLVIIVLLLVMLFRWRRRQKKGKAAANGLTIVSDLVVASRRKDADATP
ncbi:hypothetical protein FRC17_005048 [Serendipita sp. 399]|nr:hypothetical protein FRC17_005048 [Serendipita sp. 399]